MDPQKTHRSHAPAGVESSAAREAAAWVQQFGRTIKTCRLYDPDNPTVVKFRADLAAGLAQLLDLHRDMTLVFSAGEILCETDSGESSALQEETLAATFYRDGIRRLTLHQGIEQDQVDALVDIVLRVSGPQAEDEDLVTLIWDADLPNVTLKYVAFDADLEGADDAEDGEEDAGGIIPWPSSGGSLQAAGSSTPGAGASAPAGEDGMGRSDDWLTHSSSGTFETVFEEIEKTSQTEVDRFQREYGDEYKATNIRTSLDLMQDCLEAATGPEDVNDIRRFLYRPLHEALGLGQWSEASEALELIHRCGDFSSLEESFLQDLCQERSLTSRNVITHLDRGDTRNLEMFIEFVRGLGPGAVAWLMHLLAASEERDTRLALADAISELCGDRPEQMLPWLSDSRWYVVRNVIYILGRIGGPRILDLVRRASDHDELRVRHEVVSAAAAAGSDEARPLLIGMLNALDTRAYCAALRQLSDRRDPELARILIDRLRSPGFHDCPPEERRSVYVTISAVGDDDVVPALEAELNKGSWLSRSPDSHQRAVARCLLHLGSSRAAEVLAAGRRSRRRAVRRACEQAMGGDES